MEAMNGPSRSLSIRMTIGCVSGSPKRALNSSTIGPRAVMIKPQYRMPRNSAPSSRMPATTGRAMWLTSQSRIWSSTSIGVEYAPMPPVFGPVSPSPTRLWSWAATSGVTRSPSLKTRNESSSPSRNSSSTTRPPASPTILPDSMSAATAIASSRLLAMTTPLPAASPSALTTTGARNCSMFSRTSPAESQTA